MNEKRLEIMERASLVYMKYGIKSITMDDLARELGISKKTIYEHFTNKDELICSIMEMKTEMDQALCLNCAQQSENAIDDLIRTIEIVTTEIGNINLSIFYDLHKYHTKAWEILENHKWQFVLDMIRANIQRGISEGLYRKDLDSEVIARLYVGSIELILNPSIFAWPDFTFDKLFRKMLHFHIRGMASDKGIKYLNTRLPNEA